MDLIPEFASTLGYYFWLWVILDNNHFTLGVPAIQIPKIQKNDSVKREDLPPSSNLRGHCVQKTLKIPACHKGMNHVSQTISKTSKRSWHFRTNAPRLTKYPKTLEKQGK
jgi:hypothetical protein